MNEIKVISQRPKFRVGDVFKDNSIGDEFTILKVLPFNLAIKDPLWQGQKIGDPNYSLNNKNEAKSEWFYLIKSNLPNASKLWISEDYFNSRIIKINEHKMKITRQQLKEVIKNTILEITGNEPKRTSPEPTTLPKPTTTPGKSPKRRTLQPPKEAPKTEPKAEGMGEKNIVNKIVQRFKSI